MVRKALLAAPDVCSHFYYSSSILSWDALFSWLDIYKRERESQVLSVRWAYYLVCIKILNI